MPRLFVLVLFILSTVQHSYCDVYHVSFLTYMVGDTLINNR